MRKLIMLAAAGLLLSISAIAANKLIHPKEFPKGRPFSPGILAGNTLYVAGQTGQDLKTGKIPDNFEEEVKQTFNNIGLILKEAGMGFDDVVAVQVHRGGLGHGAVLGPQERLAQPRR